MNTQKIEFDMYGLEELFYREGSKNHNPVNDKGDRIKTTWEYIPLHFEAFQRNIDFLKTKYPHLTSFHELGSGIGTKTIYAKSIGFDAYGYEFDTKLLSISDRLKYKFNIIPSFIYLDLSSKDFVTIAKTFKNSLVYFYSPFYHEHSAKWIKLLVKTLKSGNIIYPELHCKEEKLAFNQLVKQKKLRILNNVVKKNEHETHYYCTHYEVI